MASEHVQLHFLTAIKRSEKQSEKMDLIEHVPRAPAPAPAKNQERFLELLVRSFQHGANAINVDLRIFRSLRDR